MVERSTQQRCTQHTNTCWQQRTQAHHHVLARTCSQRAPMHQHMVATPRPDGRARPLCCCSQAYEELLGLQRQVDALKAAQKEAEEAAELASAEILGLKARLGEVSAALDAEKDARALAAAEAESRCALVCGALRVVCLWGCRLAAAAASRQALACPACAPSDALRSHITAAVLHAATCAATAARTHIANACAQCQLATHPAATLATVLRHAQGCRQGCCRGRGGAPAQRQPRAGCQPQAADGQGGVCVGGGGRRSSAAVCLTAWCCADRSSS